MQAHSVALSACGHLSRFHVHLASDMITQDERWENAAGDVYKLQRERLGSKSTQVKKKTAGFPKLQFDARVRNGWWRQGCG